jgi:hypothetical protein
VDLFFMMGIRHKRTRPLTKVLRKIDQTVTLKAGNFSTQGNESDEGSNGCMFPLSLFPGGLVVTNWMLSFVLRKLSFAFERGSLGEATSAAFQKI